MKTKLVVFWASARGRGKGGWGGWRGVGRGRGRGRAVSSGNAHPPGVVFSTMLVFCASGAIGKGEGLGGVLAGGGWGQG